LFGSVEGTVGVLDEQAWAGERSMAHRFSTRSVVMSVCGAEDQP
jgi:hypothetical protein